MYQLRYRSIVHVSRTSVELPLPRFHSTAANDDGKHRLDTSSKDDKIDPTLNKDLNSVLDLSDEIIPDRPLDWSKAVGKANKRPSPKNQYLTNKLRFKRPPKHPRLPSTSQTKNSNDTVKISTIKLSKPLQYTKEVDTVMGLSTSASGDAQSVPKPMRSFPMDKLIENAARIIKDRSFRETRRGSRETRPTGKSSYVLTPTATDYKPIHSSVSNSPPMLAHDLGRVLFEPLTFHPLQDPRTGVYNFTHFLEDIIDVDDFDFEAISAFVTSSRDKKLLALAKKHNKSYYSSTSSMTSILSHMHFLLSNFRKTNMNLISKNFPERASEFTRGAQMPAVVILKRMENDKNIFSIDSDKSTDREIILSVLGHALEAFLTTEEPDFKRKYDKSLKVGARSKTDSPPDSYHYAAISDFILRSQLDSYHPNLPGTGVFDLKTRAVAAIRHDIAYVQNNDNHTGYEINKSHGKFESYEREFFELIRSTLLKYSLQARIGNMDGIFVAYHNISKIFGFQYLPLEDIDYILHSCHDLKFKQLLEKRSETLKAIYGDEQYIMKYEHSTHERETCSNVADAEFKMSMHLLRHLLRELESKMPRNFHACRLTFKTEVEKVPTSEKNPEKQFKRVPVMYVLATPLTKEQTDAFQSNDLQKALLKDNESVPQYIEHIHELNEQTTENIVGFKVYVKHQLRHHLHSVDFPKFAGRKQNVLDKTARKFVVDSLKQDYYSESDKWRHPSFFHPLDVNRWKIDVDLHEIQDRKKVKKLYRRYMDEKLHSLEQQSIVRTAPEENGAMIARRIAKYMNGETNSDPMKEEETVESDCDNSEVTQLQATLRAYSKKGGLRRRELDSLRKGQEKITWKSDMCTEAEGSEPSSYETKGFGNKF